MNYENMNATNMNSNLRDGKYTHFDLFENAINSAINNYETIYRCTITIWLLFITKQ